MRAPGPLTLPLLAAVLLHALALAAGRLHLQRQEPPTSLRRADDTPDLLVFSRQPPESPEADPLPLPPLAGMPSPPAPPLPPVPKRAEAPRRSAGPRARTAVARRPRPARPAPLARAAQATAKPAAGPAAGPLDALQRARQGGEEGRVPALEGEEGQAWRTLWRTAGPAVPLPAALAAGAEGGELRSMALEQAREQGVDLEADRVLRLDGQLLLAWTEAERLWLLKVPG